MKRSTLAAAAGVSVAGATLGVRTWMQRRATTALPLPGQTGQMSLVVPGFSVLERVTGQGDPQRPLPLVLVLHGVGADERQLVPYTNVTVPARLVYIRGPLAERSGFSYFAPRFKGDPKRFLAAVEDMSAHIVRVLDVVVSQRATSRTLVLGYSQGGHVAWILATTGRFDAVMVVSGALPVDYQPPLSSGRSVIHAIHGENDKALPVLAGEATFRAFRATGYEGNFARVRGGHKLATLGRYMNSTLSNVMASKGTPSRT